MPIKRTLLKQMKRDSARIAELAAEDEAHIAQRYRELERDKRWVRNLFRTVTENEADIDEMVIDTLHKYLAPVRDAMRSTGGLKTVAGGIKPSDDALFHPDLGLYGGHVVLEPGSVERIPDLEEYAFRFPRTGFARAARSVRIDYLRRRKHVQTDELEDRLENYQPERVKPPAPEDVRKLYLAALPRLAPVRRAAWILCRDEYLTPEQAEPLLRPLLHWKTARTAVASRPLSGAEAGKLLGRKKDVSSDASRAAEQLAEILSGFYPNTANTLRAKLSR